MIKKSEIVPSGPSLYLDEKQLPEIRGWDVGKSYEMTIKVKMTSLNETEENQSAGFEITEINDNKLGEKSYSDIVEEDDEPTDNKESEGEE